MSKWTQERFNKDHAEPRDYGEGEYYIVGAQYSDEEAAKLIGEWESMLTGKKYTYKPSDIIAMQMYVSNKNDDRVDDWMVNNWSDDKPIAVGKGVSL